MTASARVLEGRRAVVMGGGSGIGFASARLLARAGAMVTIAHRTDAALVDAERGLAAEGLALGHGTCDAMDGSQVPAAVDAASNERGPSRRPGNHRCHGTIADGRCGEPASWAELTRQLRAVGDHE